MSGDGEAESWHGGWQFAKDVMGFDTFGQPRERICRVWGVWLFTHRVNGLEITKTNLPNLIKLSLEGFCELRKSYEIDFILIYI